MASGNAVWGIDIGQCALKAIKLRPAEDGLVEAVAFDVIEHSKILSQPDADRDELISSALAKFTSRNDWQGDQFIVGVPGQQTFARFCKMPPIDLKKDAKKIPQLVRYEASQQIPFDMDDVVWDYQVFTDEDSPDIEVGIFAIRKDLIRKHLTYFSDVGIAPICVQTIPAALYNFCQYDGQAVEDGATVMIDVGAQNTDLIIVEPNAAWTRNIPLGGNAFTETLVRSFKLSFAKAESLKRSAADSKYARQVFQAMRPVFSDLVAEIQRSIGFYSSTHRDVELKKVLALGNAFRLPGLLKYLENNLTISGGVGKLEQFEKLAPSATVNAPQFTENVLSFAAAYGLALQGLGMAKIGVSLLPVDLARAVAWKKKRPFFVAAAAALLLSAGVPYVANGLDVQALESTSAQGARSTTASIVAEARKYKGEYNEVQTDTGKLQSDIEERLLKLQEHRLLVPRLLSLVNDAMAPPSPPELARAKSSEEFKQLVQSDLERYSRPNRRQLIIESLDITYAKDISSVTLAGGGQDAASEAPRGGPPSGGPPRGGPPGGGPPSGNGGGAEVSAKGSGFVVHVQGRLLCGQRPHEASRWLEDYFSSLRETSRRPGLGLFIPEDPNSFSRGAGMIRTYHEDKGAGAREGGALHPDPLTGAETKDDWKVTFAFKVQLGEAPQSVEQSPDESGDNPAAGQ